MFLRGRVDVVDVKILLKLNNTGLQGKALSEQERCQKNPAVVDARTSLDCGTCALEKRVGNPLAIYKSLDLGPSAEKIRRNNNNSRVAADVWKKDVGEFQAKSGSSGSCRLFQHFLGKIAVPKMSGKTPGSPRHPSSRHPRPSEMETQRPTQNPEIPKKRRVYVNFFEKFARTFAFVPVTRVRNPTELVQKNSFRWSFLFWVDFFGWIFLPWSYRGRVHTEGS